MMLSLEGSPTSHQHQIELPSVNSLIFIIQQCRKAQNRRYAMHVHAHICAVGLDAYAVVGNHLVPMFVECGCMPFAQAVFNRLDTQCNEYSWTSLIQGYVECGEARHAANLYPMMQVSPSKYTFVALLKACAMLKCLQRGEDILTEFAKKGFERDPFFDNTMVDMYAKCGSLAKAQEVFDQLPVRDIVSWNALITGYTEHGLSEEVLHDLERMQLEGISPDAVTFVCSLKACGNIGALPRGQELHAEIAEQGFEKDPFVTSILVDMYARCGSLSEAQEVFDELQDRGVVVWTVLIRGYAEHGLGKEALNCLKEMEMEGVLPNDVTMLCIVKACGSTRAIDTGRSIHAKIIKKGFEKNHFVDNSLVDMYVKCDSLVEARKVFDKLSVRDVVSWTALIAGYTEQGLGQEALKCLKQMQGEGMPLDAGIYVCCLKACGNIRDINRGQELHAEVAEEGFEGDQNVGSSLVVMYAKCNSLAEAQDVFDELQDRDVVCWNALATGCAEHGLGEDVQDCFKKMQQDGIAPDVVSWNALVLGYAEQGESEKALISYAQMQEQGFPPNVMIFLGILKACGNAAALQSGKKMQAQIHGVDDTKVVLATALVDMYGKCGRMVDAQKVFDGVSMRVLVGYNALIMGYARHGDSEPVFSLFEKMREEGVQPDAVTFLSILTVCNHAGLPDSGHKYFEDMNKKFDITPTIKHYTCMLDLLGRTGQLDEAVVMVDKTPFEHDFVVWCTMLGACQVWGDTELGRWAFDCAASSGKQEALEFILMSNIYADARI